MRFILGVIIGIALGACVGLLVANQSGGEFGRSLRQRMRRSPDEREEA